MSNPTAPAETGSVGTRVAWLHLAVLWTFAFAQPLFQLLADSPEFLIVRGNAWPDLLIVCLALVLLPPSVMVAVEVAMRGRPDLRRVTHLVFVALLTAALVVQVLKDVAGPSSKLLPLLALAAGAGLALLYDRGQFLPTVLTVLGPAPLVVLVWFLAISPASALVFRGPTAAAATGPRISNPVPVVVVIFDELSGASLMRDGRIDGERYPAFARLADAATWYPNATTVEDNTVRAVPTILTGRHAPSKASLPIDSDWPPSIFDRLAGQYRYHVYEPVTHLCPDDLCRGSRQKWPERAAKLVLSMGSIMRKRLATEGSSDFLGFPSDPVDDRPEKMRRYVSQIQPGRTLNLLHMVLPHSPYQYGADGRRYTTSDSLPGLTREHWGPDPKQVADAERRYLLQLRFTDKLLGELLDALDTSGLYDNALLVVVADHGVSFHPNASRRYVTDANVGDIGSVPMFIKAPGQREGRVDPTPARTIDVVPTIGDYLGADWASDGRSLEAGPVRRGTVRVASTSGPTVQVPLAQFVRLRNRSAEEFTHTAR